MIKYDSNSSFSFNQCNASRAEITPQLRSLLGEMSEGEDTYSKDEVVCAQERDNYYCYILFPIFILQFSYS